VLVISTLAAFSAICLGEEHKEQTVPSPYDLNGEKNRKFTIGQLKLVMHVAIMYTVN
jgi:hypothetical protein